MPGIIGSTGWERSRAWIWLFSSTHSTTALSGGLWYSPTTSTTFSTNSGSVDSLNPSLRWGCRPKSFQIRPIVDLDSPDFFAIEVRDQWVALAGLDSNVVTRTSSTWSRVIEAGRPGRSSSTSPSRRLAMNRARHLPTVTGLHCNCAATVLLSAPSAHARTIFERSASACDDFARRDHETSCERSASVNINTALGRPVLAMPQSNELSGEFQARDTSVSTRCPNDEGL